MTYLKKSLINPQRIRKISGSFSWIDRRFIREGYLESLSWEAALLYFFLVSDREGLSFYGDERIGNMLKINKEVLRQARQQLIEKNLIAWSAPLYQVLSLEAGD
ncbi:MAG: hypothetical protein KKB22_03620 [Candidatus Omnitrophica bacterium]|nr:hypothetical protein [Candidatus Omnitrophota bacterium]